MIKERLDEALETKKLQVFHRLEDSGLAAVLPKIEPWLALERNSRHDLDDPARMAIVLESTGAECF